jgi:hypothetical protein
MRKPPIQFLIPVSRNPKLLKSLMRGSYKKYVQSGLDYRKKDGSSGSLWMISPRITHRCNHRCAICGQWGKKGYNAREDMPKVMGEVPLKIYKKVIDELLQKKFMYT